MSEKMSDLIPTSSAAPARQPAAVRRPKQVVTTSFSESFAGPLPPPSLLSGYEDACAGAADRIIRVAEQEAEHRRALETAIVKSGIAEIEKQFNESKRGQICAVVITLVAIAAGTYLAMNGHELSGGLIGVGGIGGIVTTFIIGRSGSRIDHPPPAA